MHRRNTRTALALLAAATLCLAACDDDKPKPGPVAPARPTAPAEPKVDVKAQAEAEEVELGGEMRVTVTVTNAGDAPARVNVPRLDRNCAVARVRRDGREPYVLERIWADLNPASGAFDWKMPEAQELAPGASLTGVLALTAMEPGKHTIVVSYRPSVSVDAVACDPVTVTVKAPSEGASLGVLWRTSKGPVKVRFRPDLAPNTVDAIASLVRSKFYDGLTFHRIVAGFMAQGGDPKGTGGGGPGWFLPLEATGRLKHARGVLSMARTNIPDTAGSQFFLMFTDYPSLDPSRGNPGYTAFGEMVEGESTLTALEAVPTKIGDATVEMLRARGIPESQWEALAAAGRIEKSTPKEPVTIESAELVTIPGKK